MIGTKEADLVTAVLLYAMRCLAEGDQHALRAMQFGPKEIEALRELNLADLYRVGALQAHCLSIALDRDVFWPMIANLRATRENEELQRTLHELQQAQAALTPLAVITSPAVRAAWAASRSPLRNLRWSAEGERPS